LGLFHVFVILHQCGFLAVPALPHKFQEMSVYLKAGLFGKPPLQLIEVAIGKINYRPAIGAYQVMVVLGRSPHQVAPAASPNVHFTD